MRYRKAPTMSEAKELKKQQLKALLQRIHAGEDTEAIKKDFAEQFGQISSAELSGVEQALIDEGTPVEEITSLCGIHAEVFAGNLLTQPNAPSDRPGHPAFVFKAENQGIVDHIEQKLRPALRSGSVQDLLAALGSLRKITTHYKRKENIFFPLMEKHGIYGPPKVMWSVDDEIREELAAAYKAIEAAGSLSGNERLLDGAIESVLSMVTKENTILIPMLEDHLTHDEWLMAGNDSADIGYVFNGGIEGGSPSDAADWLRRHAGSGSSAATEVMGAEKLENEITLPSGHFTNEELTWMLNSLPFDLTFVGADDKVRFFSETKDRIFPRTRTIIGRDVANCHPVRSLHVVEALVEQFKNGEKDSESFWIQQGSAFILIRYFAVRNAKGEYLGVVETTEDIASIKELEGNKTLLEK